MSGVDPHQLAPRLLEQLPADHGLRAVSVRQVAAAVERIVARSQQVRPELVVDGAVLEKFLAHLSRDHDASGRWLGAPCPADLMLAAACWVGDSSALAIVERELMPQVRSKLHRLGSEAAIDEALQAARAKLFAEGGIASYRGAGALAAFIAIVAQREVLMARRRTHRESGDELLVSLAAADADPVLEYARANYRAAVEQSLVEAMRGLERRDRALLRYAFAHDMSCAQLGALYGVHKATAFRWLRDARTRLLAAVRHKLCADHDISATDIESVVRLVQSRVEVSLERVLATEQ